MNNSRFDVVIVGGGMVGASLAAAIAHLPIRIALIEAKSPEVRLQADFDARSIALSYASYQIYQALDLWTAFAAASVPIETIHVSDRGHFGSTHFTAEKAGVPALGYVCEAHDINRILTHHCQQHPHIEIFSPAVVTNISRDTDGTQLTLNDGEQTITTTLVIAADGGNSSIRQLEKITSRTYDYGQTAIVANVGLARPHHNIAYERFTADGPLAMLPMLHQRSALVWSLAPEKVESLLALSDDAFLMQLQGQFGYRLGKLAKIGKRATFPLKLIVGEEVAKPGLVFIGNASQALHPIAGQGFNLGLRDVATLAEIIRDAVRDEVPLNSGEMLQRYEKWRLFDQRKTILFSDFVPRVFSNDWRPLSIARDLGLITVDSVKPIKSYFLQQNMGLAGKLPDLLCGVPL